MTQWKLLRFLKILIFCWVTKIIKSETKEQKRRFLSMLFGTLGASLLGNILAGKGIVRAGYGNKKGWDF